MRKTILALPALTLLLAATGCSSNDSPTLEQTVSVGAINIVTSQAREGESYFQKASYVFERNVYENLVKVGSSVTFDNITYTFNTPDITSVDTSVGTFGGFRFSTPYASITNSDRRVQSLQGYVTSWINTPYTLGLTVSVPSFPFYPANSNAAVISYEIPSLCNVKSFPSDAFYAGETNTSFGDQTASSSDVVVRIVAADDLKTATAIMYNAKFAPAMPPMTLIVKNLEMKAGSGTYTVSGENVIPEDVNGTPYPSFPFTSFELKPSEDDLTTVNIDFKVGTRYQGNFKGSFTRQLPR